MGVDTLERAEAPARTITRRRELPRRRAIFGGFLVALSAVGVFAAYRRAESPPPTSFVVVLGDVAPGHRLAASDLALVPMDLPPAQAATAYQDEGSLVGAVASGALTADSIVTRADVRTSPGYVAAAEFSFALDASHALGGSVQAGEFVDVVATYGSGNDAFTMTVVRDAQVISHGQGDSLAGSGTMDVRLGLAGTDEALALAHAVTQAEMFLVRSPDGDLSDRVYRPDGRAGLPATDTATASPDLS